MELLAEISDADFGLKTGKTDGYKLRRTVRAVVTNPKNEIMFTYFRKTNDYLLPGGAVENESLLECAEREVMEETGYRIKIISDLGVIIEYRKRHRLVQISHCFLSHIIGSPKPQRLTSGEKKAKLEVVWAPNVTAAIRLTEESKTTDYAARFRNKRDSIFLHKSKSVMKT
jgi:8-oxo-dGTP diphosphatase